MAALVDAPPARLFSQDCSPHLKKKRYHRLIMSHDTESSFLMCPPSLDKFELESAALIASF